VVLQVGHFLHQLTEWGRTTAENGWRTQPSCIGWCARPPPQDACRFAYKAGAQALAPAAPASNSSSASDTTALQAATAQPHGSGVPTSGEPVAESIEGTAATRQAAATEAAMSTTVAMQAPAQAQACTVQLALQRPHRAPHSHAAGDGAPPRRADARDARLTRSRSSSASNSDAASPKRPSLDIARPQPQPALHSEQRAGHSSGATGANAPVRRTVDWVREEGTALKESPRHSFTIELGMHSMSC
jgi:hypothetical protein